MSTLWVVVVALAALGAVTIAAVARRTRNEVEPTIRAFADFRAALRPAVAELRAESADTRRRLDTLTRGESTHSQG